MADAENLTAAEVEEQKNREAAKLSEAAKLNEANRLNGDVQATDE